MAKGNQHILREYLISLGYGVDKAQERKFDLSVLRMDRSVTGLAMKVAGLATATQAFVAVWARSMERLYYSTRRAESTASSLKALDFAARSVGVSGEAMTAAIEGMSKAMRLNPGLQGLIEQFGIKVTGRDRADVMIDLLETLRKMPFYTAAQYAGLFGIDPDTLLLLQEQLDKFKALKAAREEMARNAGVDMNAAAEAGKEYANQLREIAELFGILKDAAAIALLPAMREVAGVVKEVLKDWTSLINAPSRMTDDSGFLGFLRKLGEGLGVVRNQNGGVELSQESRGRLQNWVDKGGRRAGGQVTDSATPASLFDRLENQYGLPKGLLDKMWAKESNRGRKMLSPVGASGHFQFMPRTAKEYGIYGKEDDLAASADAAARYMSVLMRKYGGDLQKALAAYNWGQGNLDRMGLGKAPAETRDYVNSISGRPILIEQTTTIHVHGADAAEAAKRTADAQRQVGADIVRNLSGVVQ